MSAEFGALLSVKILETRKKSSLGSDVFLGDAYAFSLMEKKAESFIFAKEVLKGELSEESPYDLSSSSLHDDLFVLSKIFPFAKIHFLSAYGSAQTQDMIFPFQELGDRLSVLCHRPSPKTIRLLDSSGKKHGPMVWILTVNDLSSIFRSLGRERFFCPAYFEEIIAGQPLGDERPNASSNGGLGSKSGKSSISTPSYGASIAVQSLTGYEVEVSVSNPFSGTGASVREALKNLARGRWNPENKTWSFGTHYLPVLCKGLLEIEKCDSSALREILMEPERAVTNYLARMKVASAIAVDSYSTNDTLDNNILPTLLEELKFGEEEMAIELQQKEDVSIDVSGPAVTVTVPRISKNMTKALKSMGALDGESGGQFIITRSQLADFFKEAAQNAHPLSKAAASLVEVARKDLKKRVELEKILEDVYAAVPSTTPSGAVLFSHQKEGVAFLMGGRLQFAAREGLSPEEGCRGVILGDDMGLGKTLQAIVAANARIESMPAEERKPVLVLCPASLAGNWGSEIKKWLARDGESPSVSVLYGSRVEKADWVIASYNAVVTRKEILRGLGPFSFCILDEAHYLRNLKSKRSKAIIGSFDGKQSAAEENEQIDAAEEKDEKEEPSLPLLSSVDEVWPLTGTAIVNRPSDLIAIMAAVMHHRLLSDKKMRSSLLRTVVGDAAEAYEAGRALGKMYLRRKKEDCLDLPPKLRSKVDIAFEESERKKYLEETERVVNSASCQLAVITMLKKFTAEAKVQATLEIAEEALDAGEKIVIFSEYLSVLDSLEKALSKDHGLVRIDGSVPKEKRTLLVESFQTDAKVSVFLGQTAAAGTGLTLTAASRAIVNDLPWTPAALVQAEDRLYRIGQKRTVFIHIPTLVDSLDGALTQAIMKKASSIAAFEAGAGGVLSFEEMQAKDEGLLGLLTTEIAESLPSHLRDKFKAMKFKA